MLLRPIRSRLAAMFWASSVPSNRLRAICAYSQDYEDANRNLTRYGYTNSYRKKVLSCRGIKFNHPSMVGMPFNKGNIDTWTSLDQENSPGHFTIWIDGNSWDDTENWGDWCEQDPEYHDPNHSYPTV